MFEGATGVPVLLVDGWVAGVWERTKRGKVTEIVVEPTRPLSRIQSDALAAEVSRIGAFLDAEARLSPAPS